MQSQSFSRQSRLLKPAEFRRVFQTGRRLRRGPFQLVACANAGTRPRLGITVSKRNVRNAHDRNLIKRKIRESFRLNQASLPAIDIVVLTLASASGLGRRSLGQALAGAWPALANIGIPTAPQSAGADAGNRAGTDAATGPDARHG